MSTLPAIPVTSRFSPAASAVGQSYVRTHGTELRFAGFSFLVYWRRGFSLFRTLLFSSEALCPLLSPLRRTSLQALQALRAYPGLFRFLFDSVTGVTLILFLFPVRQRSSSLKVCLSRLRTVPTADD